MSFKANARAALLLLTALNFLNYIDRNVLFAVQPLIQKEFALSDEQVGFLTSAFFICYMIAAPLIVPLADRFPAQADHGHRRLRLESGHAAERGHAQL